MCGWTSRFVNRLRCHPFAPAAAAALATECGVSDLALDLAFEIHHVKNPCRCWLGHHSGGSDSRIIINHGKQPVLVAANWSAGS
jgi:hypothetical protein